MRTGDFQMLSSANGSLCVGDPHGDATAYLALQASLCAATAGGDAAQVWTYNSVAQTLTNRNSGLCLAVVYQGTKHCAIVQAPCPAGPGSDPTQQWLLAASGSSVGSSVLLGSVSSPSQCLDFKGSVATLGGLFATDTCFNAPSQMWDLIGMSLVNLDQFRVVVGRLI